MDDNKRVFQFAEFYKIIPSGVVCYKQIVSNVEKAGFNRYVFSRDVEKDITYRGELTVHSRRRLARVLQLLLEITESRWMINPITNKRFKFRLAFQTLTLSRPQEFITDSEIKKILLEPYLRRMRRHGMKNYVWKAERQRNGNIHFHLITDCFIPHNVIRNEWNNIQNRRGYIDRFFDKYGHRDPNSTDVKAVTSEKETTAYLLKYMMKNDDLNKQLPISPIEAKKRKGKLWDCSKNLKMRNQTADFLTDELFNHLEFIVKCGDARRLKEDYYQLFFFDSKNRRKLIPEKYRKAYDDFLKTVSQSA